MPQFFANWMRSADDDVLHALVRHCRPSHQTNGTSAPHDHVVADLHACTVLAMRTDAARLDERSGAQWQVVGNQVHRFTRNCLDRAGVLGKAARHAREAPSHGRHEVRVDPHAVALFEPFDVLADFGNIAHELVTELRPVGDAAVQAALRVSVNVRAANSGICHLDEQAVRSEIGNRHFRELDFALGFENQLFHGAIHTASLFP